MSDEQLRKEIEKGIKQADRGELSDGKEVIERIKERISRMGNSPTDVMTADPPE